MSRLEELERQRALIAEHLAWLDAELSRLRGGAPANQPDRHAAPPPLTQEVTKAQPFTPPGSEPAPSITAAIDQELTKYQQEAANSPATARRGCFTLFALTLGLLALGTLGVYFLKYYH